MYFNKDIDKIFRLAAALGLPTEEGRIAVDKDMKTVLPRLYAAGDCTGGFLQIATAVGFSGQSAFCRAFLHKHGVTPAQYRAALLK